MGNVVILGKKCDQKPSNDKNTHLWQFWNSVPDVTRLIPVRTQNHYKFWLFAFRWFCLSLIFLVFIPPPFPLYLLPTRTKKKISLIRDCLELLLPWEQDTRTVHNQNNQELQKSWREFEFIGYITRRPATLVHEQTRIYISHFNKYASDILISTH